jgi:gliding motility-associated-like protein
MSISQIVENFSGVETRPGHRDHIDKESALYDNPHGIDIGPDGTIYIADRYNHMIRKIDVDGEVTTIAGTGVLGDVDGPAMSAQFFEPWGLSVGNKGEVYVADAKNNKIKVIRPDGIVETLAGTGNAGFTDSDIPAISSFFWPSDVEYDHNTGDLYVAGHLSHLIRKIDSNGRVSTFSGSKLNFPDNYGAQDGAASQASFYRPYGIHLAKDGNLYVADEWNGMIRKVSPRGVVTTIGGAEQIHGYRNGTIDSSLFNYPWDVTTDQSGDIYVVDGHSHIIRKIDSYTNETTLFGGAFEVMGNTNGPVLQATFNGATAIEYNETDGSIYVADAYNHVIRRIILLEEITLTSARDTVCEGDSVTVSAFPTFYDNYYWYANDSLIEVTTVPECSFTVDQFTSIYASGERVNVGRINSDTIIKQVIIASEQEVSVISPSGKCIGDTVVLSSGYPNAIWSTGEMNDSIRVHSDGNYRFTVLDQGCIAVRADMNIQFEVPPIISVNPTQAYIRSEETVTLIASGADYYQWSNGATDSQFQVTIPSEIEVFGISEKGCMSDTIRIIVDPEPEIIANPDTIIVPFKERVEFDFIENDQYYDQPVVFMDLNLTLPVIVNEQDGVLEVYNQFTIADTIIELQYTLFDDQYPGLSDVGNVVLVIEGEPVDTGQGDDDDDRTLPFFPNGFSPNDDGKNEFFEILGIEDIPQNTIEIFNRWGQSVYFETDYQGTWSGRNKNGKPLTEGTYFYIFINTTSNQKYSGYVIINR